MAGYDVVMDGMSNSQMEIKWGKHEGIEHDCI